MKSLWDIYLIPENKKGFAKDVAFTSRLGYNISNWQDFEKEILSKAVLNPAKYDRKTEHGEYYEIPIIFYGKKRNPMDLMTIWELKTERPRMVTAFPNNRKED